MIEEVIIPAAELIDALLSVLRAYVRMDEDEVIDLLFEFPIVVPGVRIRMGGAGNLLGDSGPLFCREIVHLPATGLLRRRRQPCREESPLQLLRSDLRSVLHDCVPNDREGALIDLVRLIE